jgi:hypothetical protein
MFFHCVNYACVHACMYVRMYRACARPHVCVCVCVPRSRVHACTQQSTARYQHIFSIVQGMCTIVSTYANVCIHMHACMHAYALHAQTNVRAYARAHTHAHIASDHKNTRAQGSQEQTRHHFIFTQTKSASTCESMTSFRPSEASSVVPVAEQQEKGKKSVSTTIKSVSLCMALGPVYDALGKLTQLDHVWLARPVEQVLSNFLERRGNVLRPETVPQHRSGADLIT